MSGKMLLSLVAIICSLMAMVVQYLNIFLIISLLFSLLAGGMWTIFVLNKFDDINTGDDLDFWMLRAWRFAAVMVMVFVPLLGILAMWYFGKIFIPLLLMMFIIGGYGFVIMLFLSFKIRRRQRMVGIWRSKP